MSLTEYGYANSDNMHNDQTILTSDIDGYHSIPGADIDPDESILTFNFFLGVLKMIYAWIIVMRDHIMSVFWEVKCSLSYGK